MKVESKPRVMIQDRKENLFSFLSPNIIDDIENIPTATKKTFDLWQTFLNTCILWFSSFLVFYLFLISILKDPVADYVFFQVL